MTFAILLLVSSFVKAPPPPIKKQILQGDLINSQ